MDKIELNMPDFGEIFGGDDAFDFGVSNLDIEFGEGFTQYKGLFDILNEGNEFEPRFLKAKVQRHKQDFVTAKNARELAERIEFGAGDVIHAYTTGDFVFGDFLEAFMQVYDVTAKKITISTLSMSEDNIAMLGALLLDGKVDELNLIISYYFYANERHDKMPMIYTTLGQDNRFQMAVARIHSKIIQMETHRGNKLVIHGSANLRSSATIEAFTIEDNPELYDFFDEIHGEIIGKYKTINKAVGGKHLREILKEIGDKQEQND